MRLYNGNTEFSGKLIVDINNEPSLIFDNLDELNEQQKSSYCDNIDSLSRGDTIVYDNGIVPVENSIYTCKIVYKFSGNEEDFEDYFLVTEITPIACLTRDY